MTNSITSIVDKIQQFLNYWERKYKYLWDQDKDAYIRRYERARKPLNAFVADITKHLNLQEEVLTEDAMTNIKFLRVDCGPLKQSLIGHCVGWVQRLTSLLHRTARAELESIHTYFAAHSQALSQEPTTLDALSASVQLHRQLTEEQRETEARFDPVKAQYSTLERFEVVLSDEELAQLDALETEWRTFLRNVERAQEMLDGAKDAFRDRVHSMVEQFRSHIKDDYAEFRRCAPYSDEHLTTEDAQAFLRGVELQLAQQISKVARWHSMRDTMVFESGCGFVV